MTEWESKSNSELTQTREILRIDVMSLILEEGKHGERASNTFYWIPRSGQESVVHLMRLVEEQAEVGEDHPQLLPAVAVLELPQ